MQSIPNSNFTNNMSFIEILSNLKAVFWGAYNWINALAPYYIWLPVLSIIVLICLYILRTYLIKAFKYLPFPIKPYFLVPLLVAGKYYHNSTLAYSNIILSFITGLTAILSLNIIASMFFDVINIIRAKLSVNYESNKFRLLIHYSQLLLFSFLFFVNKKRVLSYLNDYIPSFIKYQQPFESIKDIIDEVVTLLIIFSVANIVFIISYFFCINAIKNIKPKLEKVWPVSSKILLKLSPFYSSVLSAIYLNILFWFFSPHQSSIIHSIDAEKLYWTFIKLIFVLVLLRLYNEVNHYEENHDIKKNTTLLFSDSIPSFLRLSSNLLLISQSLSIYARFKDKIGVGQYSYEYYAFIEKLLNGIIIVGIFQALTYFLILGIHKALDYFDKNGKILLHILLDSFSRPLIVGGVGSGLLLILRQFNLLDGLQKMIYGVLPVLAKDLDAIPQAEGYLYVHNSIYFESIKLFYSILIFWGIYRSIIRFEKALLSKTIKVQSLNPTKVQAISKIGRIVVILVGVISVFPSKMEVINKLLIGIGGGGALVVGFAAKEIIGNYLSGFVIYFEGYFKVGDWIYSSDKKIEGTIEYIGMRLITLRNFDKRVTYIPNSFFTTNNIVNASRMTNRRVLETIPLERIDYKKLSKITTEIKKMLQNHPEMDNNQTQMVHFTNFGKSSLDLNLYAFTKTTDWNKYRDVQQDVFLQIIGLIEKEGGKLAYPTKSIHLKK